MLKLAILGYGVEGKSVENYFKTHPYENVPPEDIEIKIFDHFTDEEIDSLGLENYDVIFRSPSVPPHYNFKEFDSQNSHLNNEDHYKLSGKKPYWTSATKYFFEHCPCEIIAVTGTKGKGTTTTIIATLLDNIKKSYSGGKTFTVGNIGVPPLDVLDKLTPMDDVVFEISSFQLWDLHHNSFIGVLLRIEPDHLNIHKDFDEYTYAKSNVARYKGKDDFLVYYSKNVTSSSIAKNSLAHKLSYPINIKSADSPKLSKTAALKLRELLNSLSLPGEHNKENTEAALLAVAARIHHGDIEGLLTGELYQILLDTVKGLKGLPHRCQFLRELNHVKYYDDNYSSALPATDVALKAFESFPTVLIAGGKSKGTDEQVKKRIFSAPNLTKAILIGETASYLAEGESRDKYTIAKSLKEAVDLARTVAENSASTKSPAIVLMSPGFASFDMFDNFKDRGEKFQKIVKGLK